MNRDGLTQSVPPARAFSCVGCGQETTVPIPVRWVQGASGPGATLYSCPQCAPGLTPGPAPWDLENPT